MPTVPRLTGAGGVAVVLVLAALARPVGLTAAGWSVGLLCALVLDLAVARGLRSYGTTPGPADAVTLGRAVLVCAVAALTTEVLLHGRTIGLLVPLAVLALALDAVDGWVARRTGTASAFGARFDGEVDAFLILVLSILVTPVVGSWVLSAGLARYVFWVAGRMLPWLRSALPFRYWRKVVTATMGTTLALAAAQVAPHRIVVAALLLGLVLLGESFARDVVWLARRRAGAGQARGRRVPAALLDAVALVAVWLTLVVAVDPRGWTPTALLRLPIEGLALAGLVLAVRRRTARAVALVGGLVLGLVGVLEVVQAVVVVTLGRPVDLVGDAGHVGSAVDFVRESFGPVAATAAQVGAVLLVVGLVLALTLAAGRLAGVLRRRRRRSVLVVAALTVVWALAASVGLTTVQQPVASSAAASLVADQARGVSASLRERRAFDAALRHDTHRGAREGELSGLAGKDVVVAFVESYGRVALEGRGSSGVRDTLDAASARLRSSGYAARSAFLTSPTFGGVSWLAHATLLSGVWVDDQSTYDRLLDGDHTSLPGIFGRSGWRTVAVLPSNRGPWPQGQRFYGFDAVYDSASLGYAGPGFGFSTMPDQFALEALHRLELGDDRPPAVMTVLELASSHGPWAPQPSMVPWDALGDGTVFDAVHAQAEGAAELWRHRDRVPAAYLTSITYSLTALLSFVERYGDESLVLVLVGDHQPATIVSGFGGNHDVPVTVLARDPAVLAATSSWGWQDGLRPAPDAPVWRMDAFRDRFLDAFGAGAGPGPALAGAGP